MDLNSTRTSNITGLAIYPMFIRVFLRALALMLDPDNRAKRKAKGLSSGDTFFNFIKLSFLETTVLKYRHMVRFGDAVMLDSTFPPFPSRAFDKRISNYLNNLDLTELPSGIVSISTTNCCPYACAFCSTNARHNTETDLDEELLKRTIRQVENLGVPSIILHGGEPMYRYDRFLRLVKSVSDDICLWMFTTGYGVTPEKAAELKANGLFGAWVSLDHYRPEVHNRLRGHPEAFDNACRAVESFKKAGVYTCLSLVPPEDLQDPQNFIEYYNFARDLGVAEIRVMEVKPSGREACRGVMAHSPVLAQLQQDLFNDPAYRSHPPLSGLSTWLEKDPALGCQCRFEYLFVTSTGEVQPCEATEISFGNIQDEDFLEIYGRACKAFPKPATGCIPMVMYPEVRDYQKVKAQLSSPEKSELSTKIMQGFQEKGSVPGAYRKIWPTYEQRLRAYQLRRADQNSGARHH
jgi:MoaA/NifB/PqqE/SkfB family radical SAM enzyme